MVLIMREFLRTNFCQNAFRGSASAEFFLEFVNQHCSEQLDATKEKYEQIYNKRKLRIDEQLEELTQSDMTAEDKNTITEEESLVETEEAMLSEVA